MSPKIAASQRKTKKQSQEDLNQTAQPAIVTTKKLLLRQLLVMRLIANQANSPK